jgi:hypothetical protein
MKSAWATTRRQRAGTRPPRLYLLERLQLLHRVHVFQHLRLYPLVHLLQHVHLYLPLHLLHNLRLVRHARRNLQRGRACNP